MELCSCEGFKTWYTDYVDFDDPRLAVLVCECGHPDNEHILGSGTCTGQVVRQGGKFAHE